MSLETPWWILFACLPAFFVGLSKGGLPAIGTLAVPLLSMAMSPVKAAALLLPIYVLTDVVAVWLYRRDFSARNLAILVPAALFGVGLGWATAALLPDALVAGLIGTIGVVFCLATWLRRDDGAPPRPARVPAGLFWGTISGFTSFVSHSGAPPFQVYVLPQRLPKLVFAGTSTILFAVVNAAKIPPYLVLRPFSGDDWRLVGLLLPSAILGTLVGAFLTRRISDRLFFGAVQVALFLVSLKLLADSLRTLF